MKKQFAQFMGNLNSLPQFSLFPLGMLSPISVISSHNKTLMFIIKTATPKLVKEKILR